MMNDASTQQKPRSSSAVETAVDGHVSTDLRDGAAVPRLVRDEARIRAKTAALKNALRGCGGRELEMLIRYYAGGQDMDRVAAEMRASREELENLTARLRDVAARATARGVGPH